MNNRHFTILRMIFYATTDRNICVMDATTLGQGKRVYNRIKYLENEGYINVIRDKGCRNIYRITGKGVNFVMGNLPYQEFEKLYENRI